MLKLKKIISDLMPFGEFDVLGVGVIDFKKNNYSSIECTHFNQEVKFNPEPVFYFDLASLTKPLTNSLTYFLHPEKFDDKNILCLNHRGGVPAWGRLPHKGWKEQILSYPVKESENLYSDFSALRVMLELEKKGIDEKKVCSQIWDKETVYWTDLASYLPVPQCGFVNQRPNFGKIHDPNALVIKDFCSHAGLFSTTDGLCRTLLNYEKETGFIAKVKKDLTGHSHRFSFGWDRVENPNNTLAGVGCGPHTFGHLGFTGTSIWIDPDKNLGHIILSNATKNHWFNKENLNDLRKAIGEMVWAGNH